MIKVFSAKAIRNHWWKPYSSLLGTPRARAQHKTQTTTGQEILRRSLQLAGWQWFQILGPCLLRVWKKSVLKNKLFFSKVQEKSHFITAVQVFIFSDFILIKGGGGMDFGQASHCKSPSQESPTPLYHPIPFNVSAIFLHFSVFQEEGRACLAVGEILWNLKMQVALALPPKKVTLPELFLC